MGVIAPEKKRHFSYWWILIIILIFGVPIVTVELLSNGIFEKHITESEYKTEEVKCSDNEDDFINLESIETNVTATRFSNEAAYYYKQPITKNRKTGLYNLSAPVMDGAKIFKRSEYIDLASFILETEKQYGIQIVVLTVNNMHGMDIESFGVAHAQEWRLGQEGKDNGVLLTISMEERDVRIDTGYGSEAVLTDVLCGRIIRNIIIPAFKKGNYYEGVSEAVKNMAGILSSDESLVTINRSPVDNKEKSQDAVATIFSVIFLLILVKIFFNILFRAASPRYGRRRGSIWPWIFLGSMNSHSNSNHHGGSSFGGFHGGGGGFGGGGASGHW